MAMTACGGDDDSAVEIASAGMDEMAAVESDATDDAGDLAAPSTGGLASTGLPVDDFGRDVIRNVGLTLSTSDVAQTIDDIGDVTTANGGAISRSDVTIEDPRSDGSIPGGGFVVIRVPPQDLDRLLDALDGVGVVSRLSQDAEDVTDQLTDLEIRIRQAETGIDRIEEILASAVELDDVFAIENELADRVVALERLRAAERSTDDLVALATLTVEVQYRTPSALDIVDEPRNGISDAFASGWSAFVGFLFAVGYVLAISAPFLVTAAMVLALATLIGRRWSRRSAQRREQRRLDADRRGPATPAAHQPPPPVPAAKTVGTDLSEVAHRQAAEHHSDDPAQDGDAPGSEHDGELVSEGGGTTPAP